MSTLAKNARRLEFGFGVELDRDGKRIPARVRKAGLEKIRTRATQLYGGCTIVTTVGDWHDPITGITHSEEGRTVIVYVDPDAIRPLDYRLRKGGLIYAIKTHLKQAAVAYCATEVRFKIL